MNDNYIEFYFDCSSPWTYLGFIGIQELTERYGIELRLVPILVGGIFNSINPQVYEYRKNPMKIKDNYYSNQKQFSLFQKSSHLLISFSI